MSEPQYHLEGIVHTRSEAMEDFEGPLDVIFLLLSKNKIEIQDVSITAILEQYLAYLDEMKRLDMEIASEFITMASHLMLIKTKMLLSAAEQQERPAQHSAQRTAREPCAHTIMITGSGHLRGGLVGGDVRKDDDRAAGEDEPQRKLGDMGQQVFAPGVEDSQIAQRCAQHEASAAEHAEQDIVHRAPGRAARHESQRHEHQPRKQGDEPRGHPVLCPVLAARGCAAPGGLAFSLCHVS